MSQLTFKCPGCKDEHVVPGNRWHITGTSAKDVTCEPSLLVTSGHFCAGQAEENGCWCSYNREHPTEVAPFTCYRCHSWIRGGHIEFLADCSHALAGQTVPVPEEAKVTP